MEYKPFTKKQKVVICQISGIVSSWLNSNDITSPTMNSDIWEELRKMIDDVTFEELLNIEDILHQLLSQITEIK